MNIFLFVVAGAAAGWIGFAQLGFNAGRGMLVSLIIGGVGGYVGGKFVGPMVGAIAAVPGEFSPAAMFISVGVAGALLYASSFVHDRFGV